MSIGEKIYLAVVVLIFASFIVLFGTLCLLDSKDEKIERWRDRKAALSLQRAKSVRRSVSLMGAAPNAG